MTRGGKSRWAPAALCALVIALVALAPSAASAVPNEYDFSGQVPTGGNEGGSSPTAPTAPTTPYYAPSTGAEVIPGVTEAAGGKGKKKKRPEPAEPVLGSSSVNGDVGPQRIPPLEVEGSGGGVPFIPLALAILAAGCCVLAVWRMRYLRELPTASAVQPRAPAPRTPLAPPPPAGRARTTPSLG